ncbi:MAG: hypothetical protein AB1578_08240 [Thermodesulfobacteriota bacterium]
MRNPAIRRRRRWYLRLAAAAFLVGWAAVPGSAAEDPCLECHGLYGLGIEGRPLWMHRDALGASLHGRLACADCHKGVGGIPHGAVRIRCDLLCHVPGASHEALAASVERGAHAGLGEPACLGCHRSDISLRGAGARADALCLSCHPGLGAGRIRYPDTPGAFGDRAHRRSNPPRRLPTCADCHGVHELASGAEARQRCGAPGCHPGADATFGALFDHRGEPGRAPWGGAGAVALALGGALGAVLLAHGLRGSR